MARLQDRKIEVLSARTADTTTWALPSGELQTAAYAGPVRVKQDGVWQDIDTSLSDTGSDLTPAATAADVAVSDGGDTSLASVAKGEKSFGLGWQDKLPIPVVKGNTASYDLGDGQKLTVSALAQGFTESVVLDHQPDGPVSYRLPLNLDGLKLSQADSGHLLLKDTDGKLVAEASAPMMWDSTKNPVSGESDHQTRVATTVETDSDGTQSLVLTPAADFLATATYPVTVDPTSTLAATTDTWVQTPDYPDSQQGSQELKSGTYDTGQDVARSYLNFDVAKFKGKRITSATMSLYSYYSSTCATGGPGTQARRITTPLDTVNITWGTQPSTTTTNMATNTGHWGYDSSCPAAYSNWTLTGMVQDWADGAANYGIQVRSADETDPTTWRRFRSANYTTAGYAPKLSVTYNSYATTSSAAISPSVVNAYNGSRYVTSLTPTLSAKVTDPDGSSVKAQFEISPNPANADTTYTYTGTSASVASGATAKLTIPSASAFPVGVHLRYRVRAYDGTDYGSWSGYSNFGMNTGLPVAPTIVCDPYSPDTWTNTATGPVTCTLDTTSTDGQGFKWSLDNKSVLPNSVYDTGNGTDGDPLTITISPTDGWHTLYAQTIDSAGNLSTGVTAYAFGVGSAHAGLLTPNDGDSSARRVSLTSTGDPSFTGVTYQYRSGETDTWHNVLVNEVTKTAGGAITAWPMPVTGGTPAPLTWNVTTSLPDGPIDIRASFTGGTTPGNSQPRTITIDRNAGTAPSDDVGPGSVNDLTGDLTISDTDASGFGLSVSRSASSRKPTAGTNTQGQAAIFGPQWTSGTTAELTDSDWTNVHKVTGTSVALTDIDGTDTGFTATNAGGWKPEPGSEDLTLVSKDSTTGKVTNDLTKVSDFTLKDDEGTTTTFARVDSTTSTWVVASSYLPTANSTTTMVSDKVPGGGSTFLARPKYVIAPTTAVSADQCQLAIDNATAAGKDFFTNTSTNAGCRVMQFVYSTSTSATSTVFGEYTGRVAQIKLWAVTPGATTTTASVVAQYAYDDSGRLRQEWDPRISPALKTSYTYDTAGRITTLTPPGELPWTLNYNTDGSGMLWSASRPNLKAGSKTETDGTTATTSVVYNVPLSGDGKAPNKMAGDDVKAWGQTDIPSDATAVFPAAVDQGDFVPTSHDGADLATGDYKRATITYTDASGREVNTATPGGHITTTEYDQYGNTVRELTASNRDLALTTDTNTDAYDELAELGIAGMTPNVRAEQLSTRSVYNTTSVAADQGTDKDTDPATTGQRQLEELGPLHQVTLASALKAGTGGTDIPAGTAWPARTHTVNTYDQGRPTDGTATTNNQVTTIKTGAFVDGYPSDGDVRTSTTAYDWVKGLPTKQTTDPAGLAITTSTSYDAQGRVIKTGLPKSNGADAGTTVTTYWAATGTGACNGRPEWADQVCSTGPAGAITGGGTNPSQLPTKTIEYDRWGNTAKVTETANGSTRTTTSTYYTDGRVKTVSITGGTGAAVPDTTTTYDPDSGDVATVTAGGQTISHSYDQLGREISYSDGAGNTTTSAYDALGRVVKTTDSAPSTTTYTYDTAKDPRGLETSRTDSVAGTFSATYDADGDLATQTLPSGYILTLGQDETGQETSRVYTRDSDNLVVASDTADHSIQDQIVGETGSNGQTRDRAYTYDQAGRLTRADDTAPDGSCTRRDYTFDNNTNRTALAATSDIGAACTSTGATTTPYTYDSADRLTTAGTVYDAFGRTTTQASGATIGYYTNDLVRNQTSGTSRQTWTLDAAGRLAAWTTETNTSGTWTQTAAKTNHFGADGDSPDWIQETTGSITRNVQGISGDLDATTSATGDIVLQLTDIHGDTTVQLPLDTAQAPVSLAYDEYGNLEDATPATRYGWLGGKQRSSETVTGASLMGVRLYDPTIGRFLSVDPVFGGNANAYEYCHGDPLNRYDLNGKLSWWRRHAGDIAGVAFGIGCTAFSGGWGAWGCAVGGAMISASINYHFTTKRKKRHIGGYWAASWRAGALAGVTYGGSRFVGHYLKRPAARFAPRWKRYGYSTIRRAYRKGFRNGWRTYKNWNRRW
ncbi:DNRLRE domain-containing protein [Streptomyces sp. NPDC005722]